jgi:hypothetical protein
MLIQVFICNGQSGIHQLRTANTWGEFLYRHEINNSNTSPVIIAVIDDGFNLDHESVVPFVFRNKKENPFNNKDDDQNGYLNDFQGYDISDSDNNVSPPLENKDKYNHGTFITGTISNYLKEIFGENAHDFIKILPVKVVSDSGDPNRILDGYKGIKYAHTIGADIIVCAWNGGSITSEESKMVQDAYEQGITILSSAGNAYSELAQPPASLQNVISVAALDTVGRKMSNSNYGSFVDLCAPGEVWASPHWSSDTSYFEGKGTSLAVALVAAVAAAMKNQNPNLSPLDIRSILKNSAKQLKSISPRYRGKLGSGFLNPKKAIEMSIQPALQQDEFNSILPEGLIYVESEVKHEQFEFEIVPYGEFYRTSFKMEYLEPFDSDVKIEVLKNDELIESWEPLSLITVQHIEDTGLDVRIQSSLEPAKLLLSYESELLDSTNYYCSELENPEEVRTITDESGELNYVNNTNCKWLIKAPPNHRISFEFSEFDTEAKTDFVHLFDGDKALQTTMIAKFSGPNIPPQITSRTNQVLV